MTPKPIRGFLDHWTEEDTILPAQLYAEVRVLSHPERRLRLAVLDDAIRYFQRYVHPTDRRGRVLYEDALDWFSSPGSSEPFSFENVCEALHIDPEYVRRGLRRWRDAEHTCIAGAPRAGADHGAEPRRAVRSHRRAARRPGMSRAGPRHG